MKINGSDRNETIAEINVVPLVDIVLVILIIFMVSAPIFIKPSININLPQAASGKEDVPSNVNVTINAEGQIDYNGQTVTKAQLIDRIVIDVKKNPEVHAVIAADKNVPHGTVVEILDSLQIKGVKKFAINVQVPQ
ncbi:MAG: biopolymer transporter ExbD [Bdellovibrionales bacterium]|nr:biopolymer transporter ExbD [Bdellovibrionales bacterium]